MEKCMKTAKLVNKLQKCIVINNYNNDDVHHLLFFLITLAPVILNCIKYLLITRISQLKLTEL